MFSVRILTLSLAVILSGVIVWAFQTASFSQSFSLITGDAWGIVTLIDLYVGFILFGIFIAIFEPVKSAAVIVIVLTLFLGNIVTALWLLVRLPHLLRGIVRSA